MLSSTSSTMSSPHGQHPITHQLLILQAQKQQSASSPLVTPILPQQSKKTRFLWTGFRGKTLWDWLKLLIIPIVIAGSGFGFSIQQNQVSLQINEQQHQADLQIARDQQREMTLKACMDEIRDLLLNKSLASPQMDNEVRVVARAVILSALRQLDGVRKGMLIQFLSEAGLITGVGKQLNTIISLDGADLSGAFLDRAILEGADLDRAILRGTHLGGALLQRASLKWVDLKGAHLEGAHLESADLRGTHLDQVNMSGAVMPNGAKHP